VVTQCLPVHHFSRVPGLSATGEADPTTSSQRPPFPMSVAPTDRSSPSPTATAAEAPLLRLTKALRGYARYVIVVDPTEEMQYSVGPGRWGGGACQHRSGTQ